MKHLSFVALRQPSAKKCGGLLIGLGGHQMEDDLIGWRLVAWVVKEFTQGRTKEIEVY